MSGREQLLLEIDAYLAEHGISQTQFGREALNDTAFVSRLRRGTDVRMETADRVRAFMALPRKQARPIEHVAA